MVAIVLYQSHYDTFSVMRFLVDYIVLWVGIMSAMGLVSILFYTTYTDKVYYAKTKTEDTYLKLTSRQYRTTFLGDESLAYSQPKQVTVKEIPKGVYRFEAGDYNN